MIAPARSCDGPPQVIAKGRCGYIDATVSRVASISEVRFHAREQLGEEGEARVSYKAGSPSRQFLSELLPK